MWTVPSAHKELLIHNNRADNAKFHSQQPGPKRGIGKFKFKTGGLILREGFNMSLMCIFVNRVTP